MGFPLQIKATTTTAFDSYSNNLRGTFLTLEDLLLRPEELKKAVEQFFTGSLFGAVAQAQYSNGRFIFIPMHKGMDSFMSDNQYKEFYWDTLKRLIVSLIQFGYTPWLYTEGKYDSRLECLTDIPDGKVWIHFENVDMKEAKRIVGPHACISGGMRTEVLMRGTVDQVKDEVKRNLDICAPGGGYIFDFGDSMEHCKPENVEAVFETVKLYGKYR
jgi:uroporphyrinogen-III decarboxylase